QLEVQAEGKQAVDAHHGQQIDEEIDEFHLAFPHQSSGLEQQHDDDDDEADGRLVARGQLQETEFEETAEIEQWSEIEAQDDIFGQSDNQRSQHGAIRVAYTADDCRTKHGDENIEAEAGEQHMINGEHETTHRGIGAGCKPQPPDHLFGVDGTTVGKLAVIRNRPQGLAELGVVEPQMKQDHEHDAGDNDADLHQVDGSAQNPERFQQRQIERPHVIRPDHAHDIAYDERQAQ